MIGGWELLLIFLIILLVFGAKRLPELAQSLGKSVHEFKKAKSEILEPLKDDGKPKVKKLAEEDSDKSADNVK